MPRQASSPPSAVSRFLALGILCLLAPGCSDDQPTSTAAPGARPVLMAEVKPGPASITDSYSAIVRAPRESLLASKIPGRIAQRARRNGDFVKSGDVIFTLDTRELDQAVNVARAEVASAEAELEIAAADLKRWESLIARDAASRQSWEQAVRTHRSAEARLAMMRARLEVADSQRDEAIIRAPFTGRLGHLLAEKGQVIASGQTVGDIHGEGALELEVEAPDHLRPPPRGLAFLAGQPPLEAELVEQAAVLASSARTQRLRYRLPESAKGVPGSIARLQLGLVPLTLPGTHQPATLSVPVGAIDDRGNGPQVWISRDGQAQPVAVQVLLMEPERAVIAATSSVGSHVIALGTHVLSPGMAIRELTP